MIRAKDPRIREKDYLGWVARLPCLSCMTQSVYTTQVQVCHIRMSDADAGWTNPGMQQKPHDRRVWPGCVKCHLDGPNAQHKSNEADWWRKLGVDPVALVRDLNTAYDAQQPGAPVIARHAALGRKNRA